MNLSSLYYLNILFNINIDNWNIFSFWDDIPSSNIFKDSETERVFIFSKSFSAASLIYLFGDIKFSKNWIDDDSIF